MIVSRRICIGDLETICIRFDDPNDFLFLGSFCLRILKDSVYEFHLVIYFDSVCGKERDQCRGV